MKKQRLGDAERLRQVVVRQIADHHRRVSGGLCLGLIERFRYCANLRLVFVPIYNFLSRRWDVPAKQ
jgi:hypothetical protein